MMRRLGWLFLACVACDDGGAAPPSMNPPLETTCVERAAQLRAQCPPGSDPQVSSNATAVCGGQARELTDPDGAVSGICAAQNGCFVVCNFEDPCRCGIDRITTDGVFCAECVAGCGNGVCEGGESPQTCPMDCGAVCNPGEERCADDVREICGQNGAWDPARCRSDQACDTLPNSGFTFCQTRLSPDGGTFVDPGSHPAMVDGAPFEIRFRMGELGCNDCEGLRFVEGGARVLAKRNQRVVLIDPATGAVEETGFSIPDAGFTAVEDHLATSARLPIVVDRQRGTTFTAQPIADDTIAVDAAAVALTANGLGLAVAMAVQDAPLVALWDTSDGEARHLLRFVDMAVADDRKASALTFSPNGQLLVEGRASGLLIVWNVEEGRYFHLLQSDLTSVDSVAFHPALPRVAVAGVGGIEVWDVEIAERVWRDDVVQASGVVWSPAGSALAVIANDIEIRDAADGQVRQHLDGTGRLHFSPDGGRLLVGRLIYADQF